MCHYALSPDIEFQPLDDVLIVLHLTQNAYYRLNACARFFLEQHARGMSKPDIIQNAAETFTGADRNTIEADFDEITRQFLDLGILVNA